jgi:hypothetical protein
MRMALRNSCGSIKLNAARAVNEERFRQNIYKELAPDYRERKKSHLRMNCIPVLPQCKEKVSQHKLDRKEKNNQGQKFKSLR